VFDDEGWIKEAGRRRVEAILVLVILMKSTRGSLARSQRSRWNCWVQPSNCLFSLLQSPSVSRGTSPWFPLRNGPLGVCESQSIQRQNLSCLALRIIDPFLAQVWESSTAVWSNRERRHMTK